MTVTVTTLAEPAALVEVDRKVEVAAEAEAEPVTVIVTTVGEPAAFVEVERTRD